MTELSDATAAVIELTGRYALTRDEMATLLAGTVDGGPNGDGYYRVTLADGTSTVLIPCPRKIVRLSTTIAVNDYTGPGPFQLTAAKIGERGRYGNGAATATIAVAAVSAPVGSVWFVRQLGAGPLVFSPPAGFTLVNRSGHNRTAGQGAGVSLTVEPGNTVYLDGDTTS